MARDLNLRLDGRAIAVPAGTTVAAAILSQGKTVFRHSASGQPRGPICGMGICFECRVRVNGQPHVRSCLLLCEDGMEVETDDA